MEYKIKGYQPESMFHFFEEISAIPRGSKNEKAISEYLTAFAEQRGLSCYSDTLYNVIIKKPASSGCENKPPVMLQGHTDMVCEQNEGTNHDFEHDGLDLQVRDGILTANGTTLGADNGVAVALMLALLDSSDCKHPPLECVFTSQEEIGLNGAAALDASQIDARIMINLDSEDEGIATVSCAGGLRFNLDKPFKRETVPAPHLLTLKISGLFGGHSGMDINQERGNANMIMGRILYTILQGTPARLAEMNGGNKENAIPRECTAVLAFSSGQDCTKAEEAAKRLGEAIKAELASNEPNFTLHVSAGSKTEISAGTEEETRQLIRLLYLAPNGAMSRNIKQGGFVISSLNLGVVRTSGNALSVTFSPRSSIASLQEDTKQKLSLLAELFGFTCNISGEYPGWSFAEESKIRSVFCESYRDLFGEELKIEAIHAGLECGLFASKLPGLDAIAVGPSVKDCHTPEESLELSSLARLWTLIVAVLDRLSI